MRRPRALNPSAPRSRGDGGDRSGQPAVLVVTGTQAAHPMHLLGDVGEMEVVRERAHEHRGGVERLFGEQRRGPRRAPAPRLFLALLGQRAHPLDQVAAHPLPAAVPTTRRAARRLVARRPAVPDRPRGSRRRPARSAGGTAQAHPRLPTPRRSAGQSCDLSPRRVAAGPFRRQLAGRSRDLAPLSAARQPGRGYRGTDPPSALDRGQLCCVKGAGWSRRGCRCPGCWRPPSRTGRSLLRSPPTVPLASRSGARRRCSRSRSPRSPPRRAGSSSRSPAASGRPRSSPRTLSCLLPPDEVALYPGLGDAAARAALAARRHRRAAAGRAAAAGAPSAEDPASGPLSVVVAPVRSVLQPQVPGPGRA